MLNREGQPEYHQIIQNYDRFSMENTYSMEIIDYFLHVGLRSCGRLSQKCELQAGRACFYFEFITDDFIIVSSCHLLKIFILLNILNIKASKLEIKSIAYSVAL